MNTNAAAAPDGNTTAEQITASTATQIIRNDRRHWSPAAGTAFYVWAKVASRIKNVSIAIVKTLTAHTSRARRRWGLTTTWQRFRITETGGRADRPLDRVRQYDGNGDNWTSGDHTAMGRVPPAGQRSEKRLRPDVGVADRPRRGRSGVRRDGDRSQRQHGIATSSLRPWIEPRGPPAPRGHRQAAS